MKYRGHRQFSPAQAQELYAFCHPKEKQQYFNSLNRKAASLNEKRIEYGELSSVKMKIIIRLV